MRELVLIRTGTRAIALASLVCIGVGCGGPPSRAITPAVLSEEQVRKSEEAARAAVEAEGAAMTSQYSR